ncbi:MAG: hypothetical protein ACPGCU_03380, partial [Candidatus Poseidoniaceae archaeon]
IEVSHASLYNLQHLDVGLILQTDTTKLEAEPEFYQPMGVGLNRLIPYNPSEICPGPNDETEHRDHTN